MGKVIDLDQIGAARREAKEERPQVRFGGEMFDLPVELPFAVVEAVGRMRELQEAQERGEEPDNLVLTEAMSDVARALFGRKFRRFLDLGPSLEDISDLLQHIAPAYGISSGESEASE